jgi:hypothetical protein
VVSWSILRRFASHTVASMRAIFTGRLDGVGLLRRRRDASEVRDMPYRDTDAAQVQGHLLPQGVHREN